MRGLTSQHLQDQLDDITTKTRALVQPERLALVERAIEELHASGAQRKVLQTGAKAPEFELPDFTGRLVRSADLLALGALVVNFFRGRWCPYCLTELEAWRGFGDEVRASGALMIAISPQTMRQNEFTAEQHSLTFPLLSDTSCKVASAFGLAYTVAPQMQRHYRSILVNIPFMNGEARWQLPLPGTFILDQDGTVLFAETHADFRVRPEPKRALDSLTNRRR